jgi:pimeloyl-ACP methyl ester carboxylesterase
MIWSVLMPTVTALVSFSLSPLPAPIPQIHELHIEVDGATVRALCTDGRRQVVLLHGGLSTADSWRPVLERLDGKVGACAYDRLGSGESVPRPQSRGWYEFIDELRRIHLALGFDDDYVMVGHALGGMYARLYAVSRRTDLAGLVLVDPAHEDMLERMKHGMPELAWARLRRAQEAPNQDGIREIEVGDRLRGTRLSDIPVTVLTATIRRDGDGWDQRFLNEAARQLHASIVRGMPLGRHIPASRSGPDVQLDEPKLVADEILRAVRTSQR